MIISEIQEHVRQKAKALGKDCNLFRVVIGSHVMSAVAEELKTLSGLEIDPQSTRFFKYKGVLFENNKEFGTHRVDVQFQETVRISGLERSYSAHSL